MTIRTTFQPEKYADLLLSVLLQIDAEKSLNWRKLRGILTRHPKDGNKLFSKDELIAGYRYLLKINHPQISKIENMVIKIQMKPMRTQSGVTPVTVLTKPFPCPGECIFCPSDIRMPKSYLSDEPGAQRAERNNFDPYLQTYRRLKALHDIGHPVEKIEIIILGGTWSFYPEKYQIWFIKRIFEALNHFGSGVDETEVTEQNSTPFIPPEFDKNFLSKLPTAELKNSEKFTVLNQTPGVKPENDWLQNAEAITKLAASPYNKAVTTIIKHTHGKLIEDGEASTWSQLEIQHKINENSLCRCVGLVIETRPDHISAEEILRIRRLGCTKVQIGFQSLNDQVLSMNKRGHSVQSTRNAVKLLRQAGFKIHAHWMANLYGSNPKMDVADYQMMFQDGDFCPDELKVYPCSLIETADLVSYHQQGLWKPYTNQELLKVVSTVIAKTPEYCRLTRVIRDIPSGDILVGNKFTNFREMAEKYLSEKQVVQADIRSREIKLKPVARTELNLDILKYKTSVGSEYFLQFITEERKIAGFLRLCLPNFDFEVDTEVAGFEHNFCPELNSAAIIREVHVYGKAINLGDKESGKAQHLGLGTELIETAKQICSQLKYQNLAVISAIGTRQYYQKRGFELINLYQVAKLY